MASLLSLLSLALLTACGASRRSVGEVYTSPDLRVERLAPGVYLHVSYLDTESFGRVACNGLVYVADGEALVFDTPTSDSVARALIAWIEDVAEARVVGVVPTHFHVDCLGGLAAFHAAGVPSYAFAKTCALAGGDGAEVPQTCFRDSVLALAVGGETVEVRHPGPGHTRDNVVAYLPAPRVLFGGCLVKELGAGEGNLADADVAAWSRTVARVRAAYPGVRVVVPGHGAVGGVELLEFTEGLFAEY